MAEAICRHFLERVDIPAEVSSAGTLEIEDHPAATNAVNALWMIGVDLTGHRSRGVDSVEWEEVDAAVVMEEVAP